MNDRTRSRGLSLVEVVVIVAVIGVSMALVLPAIQSAQIFARRVHCTNNLKQLGLACHNYESANGSFPMSHVTAGKGHGIGHSSHTALLPYLEHAPVYNAYNFDLEPWHVANATVTRVKMMLYLCPDNKSDTDPLPAGDVPSLDGKGVPGKNRFGRTHYGDNWGGSHEDFGDDFLKQKRSVCLGLLIPVPPPEGQPAALDRNVRLADITDGTSFTVLMSEKPDGGAWTLGGFGNSEFDVNTSPDYEGDDAKARRVFTGSPHTGGPNVLMGDGAVRTFSPKIDTPVWYALITRNGGEVIPRGALDR
jgi:prepilin-type processing-associated H-X9-DG protein